MVFYGILTRTAGENWSRLWFQGWSSSSNLMRHVMYTQGTLLEGLTLVHRSILVPVTRNKYCATLRLWIVCTLYVEYGIFYVWCRLDGRILPRNILNINFLSLESLIISSFFRIFFAASWSPWFVQDEIAKLEKDLLAATDLRTDESKENVKAMVPRVHSRRGSSCWKIWWVGNVFRWNFHWHQRFALEMKLFILFTKLVERLTDSENNQVFFWRLGGFTVCENQCVLHGWWNR